MKPNDVPSDMQARFELQRQSYAQQAFPDWPVRRDRLQRLRLLLAENESIIEQAIDADFGGRPPMETQIAEFFPTFAEINGALRAGKRWMKPWRPMKIKNCSLRYSITTSTTWATRTANAATAWKPEASN